jgi:hypothetical protein
MPSASMKWAPDWRVQSRVNRRIDSAWASPPGTKWSVTTT